MLRKIAKIWKLRSYYSIQEFAELLFSLLVNKVVTKKPSEILVRNAVLIELIEQGAQIVADNDTLTVSFSGTIYSLRKQGSDLIVFNQIILNQELAPIVEYALRIRKNDLVIMDCGSNIGTSVLFFKKKFPQATIVAIEPNHSNFDMLGKNVLNNHLKNIHLFNIGVWHKKTILYPDTQFRDGRDWSFSLKEHGQGMAIPVDTIANILMLAKQNEIDILKIDIEGGEFKLFEHSADWNDVLQKIKILSVEVHEEFGPSQFIENILVQNGFQVRRSGELLHGIRPEYV